ncbi:DNA cytosine methyltransferase [Paenibacillus terrae]|uniref:Cytosine-specific methyltransferase n=1 Tax=Paenibacillus terrae TaxID=159743 RepID=A0A0D7X6H1_9BACL|nr:DNA cytosine methyltransferase [Paenibacillus terrae]KJD46809.1 hypothetical protein QD47_04700 [Paenibacillus terrae]
MRTVDLFSGCGGMSLGFQNLEYDIVAAYEYWDAAIECYGENFQHPVFKQDLSDVDAAVEHISRHAPDIIIGGPPCQDFSHAGKRTEGVRADLTLAYGKIIKRIRPRWFVMENVDRSQKSQAYQLTRKLFKDAGYGLTEKVLNASFCGVPQNRKRFFCIGLLDAEDGFLDDIINSNISTRQTTIRDYLGMELGIEHYYRHPRNYSRRGIFSIDEPAPTVRGVNRPVPRGYIGHPNDTAPINEELRPLSTIERARLQTFPTSYQWPPNTAKTTLEQMIGNAVPVNLAEFIARSILQYTNIGGNVTPEVNDEVQPASNTDILFQEWLQNKCEMKSRSSRDVISRLRRASNYVDLSNDKSCDECLYHMSLNPEFKLIKPSVQSQLRRSIRLYKQFKETAVHH